MLLILSFLALCSGCGGLTSQNDDTFEIVTTESDDPTAESDEEPAIVEQDDEHYIIRTDWMTFYFSKADYTEAEAAAVTDEAVSVMADVRDFLGIEYSLSDAKGTTCLFDSAYINDNGDPFSMCFSALKEMYCITTEKFVHEYVHMVCGRSPDVLYSPEKIFVEGLAQYVEVSFYDSIASEKYEYFTEALVEEDIDPTEHRAVCKLLTKNGLEYNAQNYNKSLIAYADRQFDDFCGRINRESDLYLYDVGQVLVEYCVTVLGGVQEFMRVYGDSVTVSDVFGKSLDAVVRDAVKNNTDSFYG